MIFKKTKLLAIIIIGITMTRYKLFHKVQIRVKFIVQHIYKKEKL